MRLMNMPPATFLVGEKWLTPEALFIPAPGFLGWRPMADHIQRLVIPLGPTTEHHHWAIGLPGQLHLLEGDEGPGLTTRPQGSEAAGLALARRHGTQGRAAG